MSQICQLLRVDYLKKKDKINTKAAKSKQELFTLEFLYELKVENVQFDDSCNN